MLYLLFKFELRLILYDGIIIYSKDRQISFIIGSNEEFFRLKNYLLTQTGINLNKTKKYIVLDDR